MNERQPQAGTAAAALRLGRKERLKDSLLNAAVNSRTIITYHNFYVTGGLQWPQKQPILVNLFDLADTNQQASFPIHGFRSIHDEVQQNLLEPSANSHDCWCIPIQFQSQR